MGGQVLALVTLCYLCALATLLGYQLQEAKAMSFFFFFFLFSVFVSILSSRMFRHIMVLSFGHFLIHLFRYVLKFPMFQVCLLSNKRGIYLRSKEVKHLYLYQRMGNMKVLSEYKGYTLPESRPGHLHQLSQNVSLFCFL